MSIAFAVVLTRNSFVISDVVFLKFQYLLFDWRLWFTCFFGYQVNCSNQEAVNFSTMDVSVVVVDEVIDDDSAASSLAANAGE